MIDLYVPIAIAFVLVMLSLNLLPAALATYRERGILRRLATTPVGAITLLAAQMLMTLLMAVVAVLLVLGVGRLGFDVALPQQPVGFALAFVLDAAAVLAMGLVLAAVAPSAASAQGIGTVLFFPIMFFAGLYVPRAVMAGTLRDVSEYTPLGATVQALQDAAGGAWPHPLHLAVMAAYAVVFGLVAVRTFRWQ